MEKGPDFYQPSTQQSLCLCANSKCRGSDCRQCDHVALCAGTSVASLAPGLSAVQLCHLGELPQPLCLCSELVTRLLGMPSRARLANSWPEGGPRPPLRGDRELHRNGCLCEAICPEAKNPIWGGLLLGERRAPRGPPSVDLASPVRHLPSGHWPALRVCRGSTLGWRLLGEQGRQERVGG